MKDEYEVFQEYAKWRFKNDVPDRMEYIMLRDTIDFQSYLLQYRVKELFQPIGEVICDLLMGMLDGIKWLFNRWFD